MRRLLVVVTALVAVAVAEVAVIIAMVKLVGLPITLLLVLATSALGSWLLRREGSRAWRAFRADLDAGRPPGNAATDGLLVFLGGILMLVPGFVTGIGGAVLLTPQARRVGRVLVMRGVGQRLSPATATSLFGPRRVRVRYGRPQRGEPQYGKPPNGDPRYAAGQQDAPSAPGAAHAHGTTGPAHASPYGTHASHPGRTTDPGMNGRTPVVENEPIEGEIIDPR